MPSLHKRELLNRRVIAEDGSVQTTAAAAVAQALKQVWWLRGAVHKDKDKDNDNDNDSGNDNDNDNANDNDKW